jgi:hypothetical protein
VHISFGSAVAGVAAASNAEAPKAAAATDDSRRVCRAGIIGVLLGLWVERSIINWLFGFYEHVCAANFGPLANHVPAQRLRHGGRDTVNLSASIRQHC